MQWTKADFCSCGDSVSNLKESMQWCQGQRENCTEARCTCQLAVQLLKKIGSKFLVSCNTCLGKDTKKRAAHLHKLLHGGLQCDFSLEGCFGGPSAPSRACASWQVTHHDLNPSVHGRRGPRQHRCLWRCCSSETNMRSASRGCSLAAILAADDMPGFFMLTLQIMPSFFVLILQPISTAALTDQCNAPCDMQCSDTIACKAVSEPRQHCWPQVSFASNEHKQMRGKWNKEGVTVSS